MLLRTKAVVSAVQRHVDSVIESEEYLNTMDKVRAEVARVGGSLTRANARAWLQGLGISVMFGTWEICRYLCQFLGYDALKLTDDEMMELDNFWWDEMAAYVAGKN